MTRFKFKPVVLAIAAILVVAVVVLAIALSKSGAADEPKPVPPKPALTVTTIQPSQARLPIKLAANGDIVAWQEAIIGSESAGLRLAEVRVNVGDQVKAGQVLATFSSEAIQADVAQARASLKEAEARAAEADDNAERGRALQSSGAMSKQEVSQYVTAERTARARVEAAKATLEAQQLRLRYTRVTAPDDGVISARSATVGAVIGSGTELFRMIRQGRLEWRAEVTSSELPQIRRGTSVQVSAANGAQLQGVVRMIAPTVDLQSRSALVYVDLPASPSKLAPVKAGMFARGEFELGDSASLTVPQQAVVIRDGFSYVFRLQDDQRVSQVKVQTGRRLADRVEVVAGIAADAQLVASGAGFLNDGDLVKVVTAPVAAQAVPAGAGPAASK